MSASARVLVIDDDAAIRDLVDMVLSDEGHEVVAAEDGAAALSLVDAAKPDVILLDMRMPVMDGWSFAHAYEAKSGPKAPIIVCTAARDAAASAAQIHATGHLAKPFNVRDLCDCVARHVG